MTANRPVYLDYNATAPIRPEAAAAVARALEVGGNPSSVHAVGRAARNLVETARAQVAALVGSPSTAVTFVSGGAEANALAIESAAAAGYEEIIVGATEHDTVRSSAAAAGVDVAEWPVGPDGQADLAWLQTRLSAGRKSLVCLMLANNETGVIQPVALAARMVREAGGWLHVDAIQGAGKVAIDFGTLGADTLSLSAHKLGGSQGVGALVAGPRARLTRQIHGGGQERGLRAGTENVSGIAGFGAAAEAAARDLPHAAVESTGRDELEKIVLAAGAEVLGQAAPRLPQTLCFAMPAFASELQIIGLDLVGVMVSAGAACSSGKVKASHVVTAMGRPDLAACAIRVSGGWATTPDDWARCADAWSQIQARHAARQKEFA
ncbi:MAG TPA: cysteine desulfurase family protein [Caulobacteraceae bacterium]|jgi:cysteine desulfurase|nr:cysteine desulfurase family protein [Caulobacteraceae bacterium]